MKIGFWGTPDIAAYCLERLSADFDIVFAVTGADKPAGRHRKLRVSPVKEIALKSDIPLFQPDDLLQESFLDAISGRGAEIFVVVAYGKIIPERAYSIPPLKTINLHPSLLPEYRGAAPMQWVLINGEKETGVTVQLINERMDAGDVLLQKKISVNNNISYGDLYNIVLPLGATLLKQALEEMSAGKVSPEVQNETKATFCSKIDRSIAHINWNNSSLDIHNLVRGLSPVPCAWTTFRGKNMKIIKTELVDESVAEVMPGALIKYRKNRLIAGSGDGCIEILRIQPETKREMDCASFMNGCRLCDGDCFEL